MLKKTLFNKVIYKGIMGAIVGIVAGLMLGLLIWGLEAAVIAIKNMVTKDPYGSMNAIPVEILTMLGMGFGALIGSMHGGATAIAEEKNARRK